MSRIIIEVSGGCVASVYHDGHIPADLQVIVADLDPTQCGDPVNVSNFEIEELKNGTDLVVESLALVDSMENKALLRPDKSAHVKYESLNDTLRKQGRGIREKGGAK